MVVMTPRDENETRQLPPTAFSLDRPAAVRYPRGSGPGAGIVREMSPLPLGKGVVRRRGSGGRGCVAILAFRSLLKPAPEAGRGPRCPAGATRVLEPGGAGLPTPPPRDHPPP